MNGSIETLATALLLLVGLGVVMVFVLAVGVYQRITKSPHWRRAAQEAERRRQWVNSQRRDRETAARFGTRTYE